MQDDSEGLSISESDGIISVKKGLSLKEYILGLGEKAYEIERRRVSVRMWNNDSYSYGWFTDPLYVSIPFFITVYQGRAKGYFFNSPSKMIFDVGVGEYDKIVIKIPEPSLRFYVIQGPSIERVLENYAELTGKPFMIPMWALGHQISRYSYYPESSVIDVLKEYKKEGFPVSSLYLDIDYAQDMKVFSWNKDRFPDPKSMVKKVHSLGAKVIVNIGPGVKVDQNSKVFREGLGTYVETPKRELYIAPLWSGACAFPDFMNEKGRAFWKKEIKEFVESSGIDGIWLDMNEPSVFTESKTFDESTLHRRDDDDGEAIEHRFVHNAYSYFQNRATFEALSEFQSRPFILTRAGFAGIQKYAAVWSGDNVASWENMRLQIPLLTSLSISGIPYVGCDIGGYIGRSDPELLSRFYQMAVFFPIFRNHKTREGNDQEPFRLPGEYKEKVRSAIQLRYSFLPYLYSLAHKSLG